jgi:hypothetical protein
VVDYKLVAAGVASTRGSSRGVAHGIWPGSAAARHEASGGVAALGLLWCKGSQGSGVALDGVAVCVTTPQ